MYKDISPELLAVIEPVARDHGLEIVDASIKRGQGRSQVRIIVDTPQGDGRVTVDACARFSREIGAGLDACETVPGSYMLEVSSPGLNRVLGRAVDFERAVGSRVALELREALDGQRKFKGQLMGFAGGEAHLRQGEGDVHIPFAQIARAKTLYEFESPGAKR